MIFKLYAKAKAFDGSAPVGKFVILKDDQNIQDLDITLKINDQIVQEVNTSKMIFSVTQIISYVSQFITLKIGDLIFTGTPAGVGPVKINDKLEGFIGEEGLLKLNVK